MLLFLVKTLPHDDDDDLFGKLPSFLPDDKPRIFLMFRLVLPVRLVKRNALATTSMLRFAIFSRLFSLLVLLTISHPRRTIKTHVTLRLLWSLLIHVEAKATVASEVVKQNEHAAVSNKHAIAKTILESGDATDEQKKRAMDKLIALL